MKKLKGLVILCLTVIGASAHARDYASPTDVQRSLIVTLSPPFGDRYVYVSPPGPHQLSSPYHTLCGLTLETQCSQESSFGP